MPGCALLGIAIERIGLRPLHGTARIAPLLATIGISLVLDHSCNWSARPTRARCRASCRTAPRIGGGSIGTLDMLIAAVGIVSAALLLVFLRYTKLGWAVRATAQDRDAARQMGVMSTREPHRVRDRLGARRRHRAAGRHLLQQHRPQHELRRHAQGRGRRGDRRHRQRARRDSAGAARLTESYGIALFGTSYRNLFAFALLILILVCRPNGLFGARRPAARAVAGTFIAPSRPLRVPRWSALGSCRRPRAALRAAPYVLQILTNAWLAALLALSLTLVAGTAGQISLGHAACSRSAPTPRRCWRSIGWPVFVSVLAAGFITAALGTLCLPAFRLRGHYVAIATLASARSSAWSSSTGTA